MFITLTVRTGYTFTNPVQESTEINLPKPLPCLGVTCSVN